MSSRACLLGHSERSGTRSCCHISSPGLFLKQSVVGSPARPKRPGPRVPPRASPLPAPGAAHPPRPAVPQLLLPQPSPGTGFTHCGRGHWEGLLQTCSKRGLGSPGQSQVHLLTALTFPPFLVSFLCNLQTTQSKNRKGTLGPGPSRAAVPFGLVLHWFGQWLRGCHAPELWGCKEHVPTRPGWPRVGVRGPVTVPGLWVGSPWPAA